MRTASCAQQQAAKEKDRPARRSPKKKDDDEGFTLFESLWGSTGQPGGEGATDDEEGSDSDGDFYIRSDPFGDNEPSPSEAFGWSNAEVQKAAARRTGHGAG